MQLAQATAKGCNKSKRESEIEDRKDKRVKIQGTQQSELIQSKTNTIYYLLILSHAGNDNLDGFGLEAVWHLDKITNNYLIILYYVRNKNK